MSMHTKFPNRSMSSYKEKGEENNDTISWYVKKSFGMRREKSEQVMTSIRVISSKNQ